jgi:hypothetical protein
MSKALTNLRKMESRTYKDWWAAVRYVGECRNQLLLAEHRDQAEKKAKLSFALAQADQAYRMYTNVCDTLDEVEQAGLNGSRGGNA